MRNSRTSQLLQFVSDYQLRRDGLTVFDAMISFYKEDLLHQVLSQVQIITLPKEMAVYITEFFKEEYNEPEMYSTALYEFSYSPGKSLGIRDNAMPSRLLLSVLPLGKSQLL